MVRKKIILCPRCGHEPCDGCGKATWKTRQRQNGRNLVCCRCGTDSLERHWQNRSIQKTDHTAVGKTDLFGRG